MIEIRPSVAVIGAGLAGLTLARLLAGRGYPVTVFDKGRGPGGRSTTRREEDAVFDHGCQYFTVHDTRFRTHLESWCEHGVASPWHPRLASCESGSVTLLNDHTGRWVGVPGMSAPAKALAEELDVELGVWVQSIRRETQGWALRGEPEPADERYEIVIVATPAEQAVPLLAPSPALQAEAASVRMQPCWSLMLALDYDLELPFDAAFLRGSPLVWAANNGSKPGRPAAEAWVMHASPVWSRDHLEWKPEQVVQSLSQAFFSALGIKPVPTRLARAHRWRYASPENPLSGGFLWSPEQGLGACGDWCHSPRAEGAFLSGLLLAEQILADAPRARSV